MFGMSCTSLSSIVTKGGRVAAASDIPYAYYTFDVADVTDTSVLNRTSTFYDASLSSSAILDGVNNISGTTDMSLNAVSSHFVTINSPMEIGKPTGLSILFWVRYGTSNGNGTRIFDFGNDPASDNIEVYIDIAGIPNLSIYSGSTQYTYSFGYPVNTNIYRHLGITMAANGTFQYYIDGVLYKTTTGNQYPADIVRTKNFIGKSNNNALFLNGGVGEFRIYNNVVSSATVLNNMNTNVRLYNNSFMTHNYGFKYTDLQNGKIKNLVTGVYDLSFLTPVDTTFTIASGTKQIGITTGTQKNNQGILVPIIVNSRINSNFLYNLPTTVNTGTTPVGRSTDSNYGVRIISGFTTPSTGGFTINFWFYINNNTNTYDVPYFSFRDFISGSARTIRFAVNGVTSPITTQFMLELLSAPYNPKYSLISSPNNTGWYQYTLVVDYNAQTITSYINLDSYISSHEYLDFTNTTFDTCVLMNDTNYSGFEYNRPIRGFMDNFRIYNVPLKLPELRQLAQIPVIPGSRVYTLRPMATAAPVNGNVAVYMDNAASRVYLSAGVGNLYVGNVSTGTWTQSTLAAGSPGQLENRNWRDIVCNGTGQYVVACASTTTINDPSGTVFYSSDYGSTFTQTASVIDTPFCFNLAMSDNGNYTYMTAWGMSNPPLNPATSNGNLYISIDKGVTWTRITDVSGSGVPAGGNPSWASIPSQVRCNSTGEYVMLGPTASTSFIFLLNYGRLLLINPGIGSFGGVTSNPVITNRSSDNALLVSFSTLARTSSNTYNSQKQVYHIGSKTTFGQNLPNTPIAGTPQTTSLYPWTGTRNVCMSQDRNQIVIADTAGLGNVYVSTNGLQTAPWPDSGGVSGITATVDVNNLSIPNAVSQSPVPRSAWSGLSVNYNDQFVFANKTGTVYLYSWTLQ